MDCRAIPSTTYRLALITVNRRLAIEHARAAIRTGRITEALTALQGALGEQTQAA